MVGVWLAVDAVAGDADPLWALDERGRWPIEVAPVVEAGPVVLAGGTVLTAAGQRFEKGYVVLQGGRITALGEGASPDVPGATVLDLTGRFVTPGIVDTHSHLGVYPSPGARAHGDGNEATAATTAGVWAEHSIWPQDPGFERAIAGGITTLQILPGSANLIGGRGVVVRPVPARGGRAMRFPGAPETVKMACGENPKRVYGEKGGPSTRMGNLRGQREAFLAAQQYQRTWQAWAEEVGQDPAAEDEDRKKRKEKKSEGKDDEAKGDDPPARDLDQDTLVGLLEGKVLAQIHCYRADDMLAMLQVADEFGWQVRSFHHATEAYKIRDLLASRGVAASVWADWWGFKLEAFDAIPEGAALLSEAGVKAVIHSDSDIGIQRLNQEAAKAYFAGVNAGIRVSEDDALRWITANPAWVLGIEGETGTLEVGKRADVVVWDHHPFSVYAHADEVFVDGVLQYDQDQPRIWSDFRLGRDVTP